MKLILYSKQDCCLCESLLAKLQQVKNVEFELEIRDINSNPAWFDRYQYEIPVLCLLNDNQQANQQARSKNYRDFHRDRLWKSLKPYFSAIAKLLSMHYSAIYW